MSLPEKLLRLESVGRRSHEPLVLNDSQTTQVETRAYTTSYLLYVRDVKSLTSLLWTYLSWCNVPSCTLHIITISNHDVLKTISSLVTNLQLLQKNLFYLNFRQNVINNNNRKNTIIVSNFLSLTLNFEDEWVRKSRPIDSHTELRILIL